MSVLTFSLVSPSPPSSGRPEESWGEHCARGCTPTPVSVFLLDVWGTRTLLHEVDKAGGHQGDGSQDRDVVDSPGGPRVLPHVWGEPRGTRLDSGLDPRTWVRYDVAGGGRTEGGWRRVPKYVVVCAVCGECVCVVV